MALETADWTKRPLHLGCGPSLSKVSMDGRIDRSAADRLLVLSAPPSEEGGEGEGGDFDAVLVVQRGGSGASVGQDPLQATLTITRSLKTMFTQLLRDTCRFRRWTSEPY